MPSVVRQAPGALARSGRAGAAPATGHQPPATSGGRAGESGYTLAALMVILAVMAILLTVVVQSTTFRRQREKEEELIFRGNQIVEAIRLFRARNGRFPNKLTELAEADPRVLRQAWKDPITDKVDWVPIFMGQEGTTVAGGGGTTRQPQQPQQPRQPQGFLTRPTPKPGEGGSPFPATEAQGPIIGVHSRSCDTSIKVLDGRSRYCDWKFIFDPNKQKDGSPGAPSPSPTPQQIR